MIFLSLRFLARGVPCTVLVCTRLNPDAQRPTHAMAPGSDVAVVGLPRAQASATSREMSIEARSEKLCAKRFGLYCIHILEILGFTVFIFWALGFSIFFLAFWIVVGLLSRVFAPHAQTLISPRS